MTDIALPFIASARPPANVDKASAFEIGAIARSLVSFACVTMSFFCVVALARAGLGMVDNLHYYTKLPIIIHVATVLPAIPLGGYVLLARKGTPRHRLLGKIWLVLMLITATSAIFIQSSGGFSFIHIFVPVTFHAAWKTIATARKGDIAAHKRHLVRTYLMALMIPGIFAFVLPDRLMHVMLLG